MTTPAFVAAGLAACILLVLCLLFVEALATWRAAR